MTRRREQTAQEFLAELAENQDYVAAQEKAEAEREERGRMLKLAAAPIARDLRSVGVDVDSPWDLVNTSEPYPAALPVLLKHLKMGGYPPRIMQGLGRALAVRPAVRYWDDFVELYRSADSADGKDGLAVALMATVTKHHVRELMSLAQDASGGECRIYFLKPIMRLGGDEGRAVVQSLVDDAVLGKEARALVKRAKMT